MSISWKEGKKLALRNAFNWDLVKSQIAVRESRIAIKEKAFALSLEIEKLEEKGTRQNKWLLLNGMEIVNMPDYSLDFPEKGKSHLIGITLIQVTESGEILMGHFDNVDIEFKNSLSKHSGMNYNRYYRDSGNSSDSWTEKKIRFVESKNKIPEDFIKMGEEIKSRKNKIQELKIEDQNLSEMYKAVTYDFDIIKGNLSNADFKGVCFKIATIFNEGYDPFEYYCPSISEIVEFFLQFPSDKKVKKSVKKEKEIHISYDEIVERDRKKLVAEKAYCKPIQEKIAMERAKKEETEKALEISRVNEQLLYVNKMIKIISDSTPIEKGIRFYDMDVDFHLRRKYENYYGNTLLEEERADAFNIYYKYSELTSEKSKLEQFLKRIPVQEEKVQEEEWGYNTSERDYNRRLETQRLLDERLVE